MILCCQVLNEVNELMIIRVRDEYQLVCGCVRPTRSYTPKGGINHNILTKKVNELIIVWVKDE